MMYVCFNCSLTYIMPRFPDNYSEICIGCCANCRYKLSVEQYFHFMKVVNENNLAIYPYMKGDNHV